MPDSHSVQAPRALLVRLERNPQQHNIVRFLSHVALL